MAKKAGDLRLKPLKLKRQWDENYEILIKTDNVHEIMHIIKHISSNDELEHYLRKARDRTLVDTKARSGIFHKIAMVASAAFGTLAGWFGVGVLGTTTTTVSAGGILGFLGVTTTVVVAPPVGLAVGLAGLCGLAGLGAYNLGSSSKKSEGEKEHFLQARQAGLYDSKPPIRTLNPYVLVSGDEKILGNIKDMYAFLCTLSNPNWQEFLELFDSKKSLDQNKVEKIHKSKKPQQLSVQLCKQFGAQVSKKLKETKERYSEEKREIIKDYVLLMRINNEFAFPRSKQYDREKHIKNIRNEELPIDNEAIKIEKLVALFSLYKMLLNHPQNSKEQQQLQKAKMHERARELGDIAEKVFDSIVNDTRIIKLDHTNYLRYLREIIDVLEAEQARAFIETLLKDLAACMLIDNKLESYEQDLLQGVIDSTQLLQNTNLAALLEHCRS